MKRMAVSGEAGGCCSDYMYTVSSISCLNIWPGRMNVIFIGEKLDILIEK